MWLRRTDPPYRLRIKPLPQSIIVAKSLHVDLGVHDEVMSAAAPAALAGSVGAAVVAEPELVLVLLLRLIQVAVAVPVGCCLSTIAPGRAAAVWDGTSLILGRTAAAAHPRKNMSEPFMVSLWSKLLRGDGQRRR